jgi:hypothetical protein
MQEEEEEEEEEAVQGGEVLYTPDLLNTSLLSGT